MRKIEITPKTYEIGPGVKFHLRLSLQGKIPSLIVHILLYNVFL